MKKQQKGFTLAEVLITLSILGVVAAITVPSLINKQTEAANRTKVKKAMAAYEKALNQMIIENDLKSDGAITTEFPSGTCTKTTEYFKKIKEDSACVFQTADRVWWNITNIENPYIILKEENKGKTIEQLKTLAQDTTDKTVYGLVGHLDNNNILRVNDKGFETATSDRGKYLAKLYGFMNNEISGEDTISPDSIRFPAGVCSGTLRNCYTYEYDGELTVFTIYDEDGNFIAGDKDGDHNSYDGSIFYVGSINLNGLDITCTDEDDVNTMGCSYVNNGIKYFGCSISNNGLTDCQQENVGE